VVRKRLHTLQRRVLASREIVRKAMASRLSADLAWIVGGWCQE